MDPITTKAHATEILNAIIDAIRKGDTLDEADAIDLERVRDGLR